MPSINIKYRFDIYNGHFFLFSSTNFTDVLTELKKRVNLTGVQIAELGVLKTDKPTTASLPYKIPDSDIFITRTRI